jgi:hypothetical protein
VGRVGRVSMSQNPGQAEPASGLERIRPAPGPSVSAAGGQVDTRVMAPPPPTVVRKRRPAEPPSSARRRGRPRQPRPTFGGPRLADFIGWWRRLRSIVLLVVITVILGLILAAIVAVAIGAIVVTIQHALKSG